MKKYAVECTEIYNKTVIVNAESEDEAMSIVSKMIEHDEIDISNNYDGHEVTVDYADLYEE